MIDRRGDLLRRIASHEATIAVVGLGYVGLPVACTFASRGFRVRGVDIDREKVRAIASGANPLDPDEPGLPEIIRDAVATGRLTVSDDPSSIRDADVYLVAVETSVSDDHLPRYGPLGAACASIASGLRPGTVVVIESTVSPGTTGGMVRRTLESGSGLRCDIDFHLGHCPERLMPGRLLHNIRTLHRTCGGSSPEAAEAVVGLYREVVSGDLDATDLLTAELVKTTENSYYDVNIAFANEVALACEALGADAALVRRLVNKSPGRNMLLAGAGVGGACIPKDPWLLVAAAAPRVDMRLVRAARQVNDGMPGHMARLTREALARHGRPMAEARIGVLGVAYRENTRDARNSPTDPLVGILRREGASVELHDPFVPEHRRGLADAVAGTDAVLIMVAHEEYRSLDLPALRRAMRTPILVDGRRVVEPAAATAAGLTYVAVGRPAPWI